MSRAGGAACLALLALQGCQSPPISQPVSSDNELLKARWPIHNFNGYDPYPAADSAQINAYVDFGRADGLLRFSLGCAVFSMPYELTETSHLKLPEGTEIIRPDTSALSCTSEAVARDEALATFMAAGPAIRLEADFMLTLRSARQVLELNSVDYVLSN